MNCKLNLRLLRCAEMLLLSTHINGEVLWKLPAVGIRGSAQRAAGMH